MNLFIQLLVILLVLFVIAFFSMAQSKRWYEKWPAIDDEEFLLRCPKGTNPENALKIRRIVSVQLGVEYERLYPTKKILEGLDC